MSTKQKRELAKIDKTLASLQHQPCELGDMMGAARNRCMAGLRPYFEQKRADIANTIGRKQK